MMRYSNNDNITNDLTRMGFTNTNDYENNFNNLLNLNHKLPHTTPKPFNNISNPLNPFKDILINDSQYKRSVERIDTDESMRAKELFDTKDKTIDSMNSEINKLKNSLQEVIKKDKEIQELKNNATILNKELQGKNGESLKIKELEMEVEFIKKKLDDEYLISSEVKSMKKEVESIKKENNNLRKKMLSMNQEKNLFKLKKIIVKHSKCELDELNKILEENNITEDSFILNDINEDLIKKVIILINNH